MRYSKGTRYIFVEVKGQFQKRSIQHLAHLDNNVRKQRHFLKERSREIVRGDDRRYWDVECISIEAVAKDDEHNVKSNQDDMH